MASPQEHIESAEAAGLRYVTDAMPGISRKRAGRGFAYVDASGAVIKDRNVLARFRKLVIPPAWTDVWICPSENGHLQVTARDARGRKQYRYHPKYRAVRDETKFGRILAFSEILPLIRDRVEQDIRRPELSREKVLATVVWLLERTLIRVGNDEYARENGSFGLTTLRRKHVEVSGAKLRLEFKGKSGIMHSVAITDRRIARIVEHCQDLPGQELFKYLDADGNRQSIDAEDVNDYLREITGRYLTAKDFRTWSGTMLAAAALRSLGPATTQKAIEKNIVSAVDEVSKRLRNTRAVCRKYYIHPEVLQAYREGYVIPPPPPPPPRDSASERRMDASPAGLRRDEISVVELLRRRCGPGSVQELRLATPRTLVPNEQLAAG